MLATFSCTTVLVLSMVRSMAEDYVIDSSSEETNSGFTLNGDDSILVIYGIKIATEGDENYGLFASGDENTLRNEGTIETEGKQAYGIHTQGNNNTLTNAGVIITKGEQRHGIGLYAAGDSNMLTNTGEILTNGAAGFGLFVQGDRNTLINTGEIVTRGKDAEGLAVIGSENSIRNEGTITTHEQNADGFSIVGENNILSNSGIIVTEGPEAEGMALYGANNTLSNDGSITVKGKDAEALYADNNANILNNSGNVVAEGENSADFYVAGDENTLTNSGSLTAKGTGSKGFSIHGNKNILNNSASVVAEGEDSDGFYVVGDENTLINSDNVIAANGHAVRVIGDNNEITFQSPSFLGGTIDVGNSATLNVISGPSHAIGWKIEGTLETVNLSGSVPIFYNPDTQQVATFDTGEMTAANDMLGDIVTNVSGLIGARFQSRERDDCNTEDVHRSDCGLWISTFGSRGRYDGAATHADYGSKNYGLALGYDQGIAPELLVGAQLGYGWATFRAETGRYGRAFDNSADGLFASVYARKWLGRVFVDAALSGGRLTHSAQRFVNDNQAPRGKAWGKARYNSWWLAPEAAIGARFDASTDWKLTPSAGLRYVLQSLDSRHESGLSSEGNAMVAGRNIKALESHLELALDRKFAPGQLNIRSGWRHRQALGDDKVRVTLVGETKDLNYSAKNRDFLYIGADFDFRLGKHITLGIGGEARSGSGINGFQGRTTLSADF